jgi:hypothetical protein
MLFILLIKYYYLGAGDQTQNLMRVMQALFTELRPLTPTNINYPNKEENTA